MSIGKLAVKRPVTIFMCVIIVMMFGVMSFSKLSVDLMPEMELPIMAVVTTYSGAGPEEIEKNITKPIEGQLSTLSGMDTISSQSSGGVSMVIMQFNYGINLDEATNSVRDKVSLVSAMLPDEAAAPMIIKMDMNSLPIMSVAVAGNRSIDEIRKIVDDTIAPSLQRVDGVGSVTVVGGTDEQVKITVDPLKLATYGISSDTVSGIIRSENANNSGGSATQDGKDIIVRITGEYKSLADLQNTLIPAGKGGAVKLSEIATVEKSPMTVASYATLNGEPVVTVSIQKSSDGNTVAVDKGIKKAVEKLQAETYGDIKITVPYSSADEINASIAGVMREIVMAFVLAVVVILVFLRNFRCTLIAGSAIPTSIIATFILLHFGGQTLNMLTLSALTLGVGLMVDHAIVVLENIYRHRMLGKGKYQAAVEGTEEVAMAVTAQTLATVAVYLPMVFLTGMSKEMFGPFAITMCCAMLASLVVALTLVPMLSSKILVVDLPGTPRKGIKGIFKRFGDVLGKGFDGLSNGYANSLEWTLRHKTIVVLVILAALLSSCLLVPKIGAELIPAQDSGQISVSVEMPNNTVIGETSAIVAQVEAIIKGIPEVETVLSNVGSSGGMSMGGVSATDKASMTIILSNVQTRERSSKDIAQEIQTKTGSIAGANITASSNSMTSGGSPVSIKIEGDDLAVLQDLSDQVEAMLGTVEGTTNVVNSMKDANQELNVVVNREKASFYGVNSSSINKAVSMALQGSKVSKYRADGGEIDIVLQYPETMTDSLEKIRQIMVPSQTGGQVPLDEVATIVHGVGQNTISRIDQSRQATVSADIYGRDLGSIVTDVRAKIAQMPIPNGYSVIMGGSGEEMASTFTELFMVVLMAFALIYMVMASQFESLLTPFVIMFSVPVMFIGVFVGLYLTGQTINMMSIVGVLMLEGIVVGNSIVLIDYIRKLRYQGMCKQEAIIEGGRTRLRPILMTSLTCIIAMIPQLLSTASGSEIFKPVAATIVFGLAFSTLITLFLIPIVYAVLDRWSSKFRKRIMKNNPPEEIEQAMRDLEEGCWHDWEERESKLGPTALEAGQFGQGE